MRRRLNFRFLAIFLVTVAVLGGGIHYLHGRQVSRNADVLLRQADDAQKDGQQKQAAELLDRYLVLTPSDNDARRRYGKMLEDVAATTKNPKARVGAYLVMSEALRREPDNRELRREVARLAMDIRRFDEAREHFFVLLRSSANDAELERSIARCYAAKREYQEAANYLERAISHAPAAVENYVALAGLLRQQLDQPKRADEVMAALLKANPNSVQANLAHAGDCMQRARAADEAVKAPLLKAASEDVARATKIAPSQLDVLLASAEVADLKGDAGEVRTLLNRAFDLHSKDIRPYLYLSRMEQGAGRYQEAAACLRRGLTALPDNKDLLFALADLLCDSRLAAKDRAEARDIIAKMDKLGTPAPPLDFLQGRVLVAESKWNEAASTLGRSAPALAAGWPHLVQRSLLIRAVCHERLGEMQEANDAYRQIVTSDPKNVAACLGLGSTLAGLERFDDAVEAYRKALLLTPAARLPLARVIHLRNMQMPQNLRHWEEFEQLVSEAAKENPRSAEVPLLKADMLVSLPNGLERAEKELTAARDAMPDEVKLWTALASVLDRRGQSDKAGAVLEQATRKLGDRVELRLARAEHEMRRGGQAAKEGLAKLTEENMVGSPEERQRLLDGLAGAAYRVGDLNEARRLWTELSKLKPGDRSVRMRLIELALQSGDEQAAIPLLEGLKAEDANGTTWRYARLCYLLWRAFHGHKEELAEARPLLDRLAADRPGWARVAVCEGRIRELDDSPMRAIKAYQRAFDLGDRDPSIIRRLVVLLYERQRYVEAGDIVAKVPDAVFASTEMRRILADLALRSGDTARALEMARSAENSKDYRDQLVYAQALAANPERKADAEKVLRRALELAPNEPGTWVALVRFLVREGRRKEAETVTADAQKKLPPDQAPLCVGRCRELLGERAAAERFYQLALAAKPNDLATLRTMADFYASAGNAKETQKYLRKMIVVGPESAPAVASAKHALAVILASSGNPDRVHEALALVGGAEQTKESAAEDGVDARRARALVLASQPDPKQRQQAIRLFEELKVQHKPPASDWFVLGRLYEAGGEWGRARAQFEQLYAAADADPSQLSYYVRRLLARGELSEVRRWLERIERTGHDQPAAVEIRARLLKAENDGRAAVAQLKTYAGEDTTRAGQVAPLLEELGEYAAAEEMYRRAAAAPTDPNASLVLANYLARRRRTQEALELCNRAWSTCTPTAAAAGSVAVVFAGGAEPTTVKAVDAKLEEALKKTPDDATLLLSLAAMRKLQGRYAEAIEVSRKATDADGRSSLSLNNLAWLIAMHEGNAEQALLLVEEAMREAGPAAFLLDTRAVIYLNMGQPETALRDLQSAVAEQPSGTHYYHLARAQYLAGNKDEALASWRKAKAKGLTPEEIDPLERAAFDQLVAQLERK